MSSAPSTVLVIDCGSRKVPEIVRILEAAGARTRTVPLADGAGATPAAADAVVVSGGPHLFTDPGGPALVEAFAFLDAVAVPLLGICLGHQAIALRAGAAAVRIPPRRDLETIEILEDHPLLAGLERPLVMRADHTEEVDAPAGFRTIARSAGCRNEMMVHVRRHVFGVQFHPEASGGAGERLLVNFLDLVRRGGAAP